MWKLISKVKTLLALGAHTSQAINLCKRDFTWQTFKHTLYDTTFLVSCKAMAKVKFYSFSRDKILVRAVSTNIAKPSKALDDVARSVFVFVWKNQQLEIKVYLENKLAHNFKSLFVDFNGLISNKED